MKNSTSTMTSNNISTIVNTMEAFALNANSSYSFFPNELTSTSYSNESSTPYSNESSAFYSNESSTTFSNAGTLWPRSFYRVPNEAGWIDWLLIRERLILYGFSLVVILGVVGNVLMVTVVYRLRTRRNTMDQFLVTIALSDTVYLLAGPLVNWVVTLDDKVDIHGAHDILCKGLIFASNVAPTLSAWLLVAMTTQRAVAVVWPHRVGVLCTGRRTWILILALVLVFSLLYSHMLYGFEVKRIDNGFSPPYDSCVLVNAAYTRFLLDVFLYIDLYLFSYLPAACLLLGNAVLIVKLRQAGRDVGKTLADASSSSSSAAAAKLHARARETQSVSVTVISVTLAFVVLTLPLTVLNIIGESGHWSYDYAKYRKFIESVSTGIITLNYSINFYLYCLTGARFRNEFQRMVRCRARREQQRRP